MHKSQNINKISKSIVSIALLLIYVLAFMFAPTLDHQHHHEHHSDNCTEQTEIDPCHRLIYHNDENLGCEHKQHLLAEKKSCEECNKILTSSPKILTGKEEIALAQYKELSKFNESVKRSRVYYKDQSTRAPPVNFEV